MFLKADDPSIGGEGATDSGAGPLSKFLGEAMALAVPKSL
jgi:hypothetical protein